MANAFAKFDKLFMQLNKVAKKPTVEEYESSRLMNMRLAAMEKYEQAMKDMDRMMKEIEELKTWRHEMEVKKFLKKRKMDEFCDETSECAPPSKRPCRSI